MKTVETQNLKNGFIVKIQKLSNGTQFLATLNERVNGEESYISTIGIYQTLNAAKRYSQRKIEKYGAAGWANKKVL